jgi:glycosyltransferase involved in cell wall biosynthesis
MITAVTTCMGRREHLEITLPLMLEEFDRVIVVDWSCPQETGDWAHREGASVVFKTGEKHFERSQARNLGARSVMTEFIAFVDADGFCFPGLREDLESILTPQTMAIAARRANGYDVEDTFGFLACSLEAFWKVGGYDESYTGWGHEDSKLRGQLLLESGLKPKRLKANSLGAIRHSMQIRSENLAKPIQEASDTNFRKLCEYFSRFGIADWMSDPRTESIAFRKPHAV